MSDGQQGDGNALRSSMHVLLFLSVLGHTIALAQLELPTKGFP